MKRYLLLLPCFGLIAFALLQGFGERGLDSAETNQPTPIAHTHPPANSQTVDDSQPLAELVPYLIDSRTAAQPIRSDTNTPRFSHDIVINDANWLRIQLSDYELAPDDYIVFSSLSETAVQTHTARTLPEWGDLSAYFNGDGVRVELFADADSDSFVSIDKVLRGNPQHVVPDTLCEGDSRTPSTDNRVARLVNVTANSSGTIQGLSMCTAWPVSTGGLLTAGHCVDFDPDGFGSQLPDGVSDFDQWDVVEFNVPASASNGNITWAAPQDQFSIDVGSEVFNYDGEGEGLGTDWAVFHTNPQADGDTPHRAFGWWRMTRDKPAEDAAIRITGFGADTTPNQTRNFTQQTSTGDYHGEHTDEGLYHEYLTDTMGGNSGGPIIWDANQYTIGIHTNGGCDIGVIFDDGNTGASFENNALENAIDHSFELTALHVDGVHRNRTNSGNGGPFDPFSTIGGAHSWTQYAWSQMRIVEGNYDEAVLLDKPMVLVAPVGSVVIGE